MGESHSTSAACRWAGMPSPPYGEGGGEGHESCHRHTRTPLFLGSSQAAGRMLLLRRMLCSAQVLWLEPVQLASWHTKGVVPCASPAARTTASGNRQELRSTSSYLWQFESTLMVRLGMLDPRGCTPVLAATLRARLTHAVMLHCNADASICGTPLCCCQDPVSAHMYGMVSVGG
jgi:hypothetical protein